MTDRLIDSFGKNATEVVRAALEEYRGHQLFSLRIWFEVEPEKWVATKKGLSLKVELFPELKRAVEKLEAAIIEAGLLDPEDLQESHE